MDSKSINRANFGFRPGETIGGRYLILRTLGRGGLGTVYLVRDRELSNQEVALKIPHRHILLDESVAPRLKNELLLHRQLAHPSIVRIFHAGELPGGVPYFTMEYVPGCSLKEFAAEYRLSKLPSADAQFVIRLTLESLAFAHGKGIVHRDLKPENILLGRDGSVKLSDFGLAQSSADQHDFTRTGESIGTPLYMAPEQFTTGHADERTDLYAVGAIAFELLTGRPPFSGATYVQLAKAHLSEQASERALLDSEVPAELCRLILKALAKAPEQRFQTASEMLQEFSVQQIPEPAVRDRLAVNVRSHDRKPIRIEAGMTALRLLFIFVFAVGYFGQIKGGGSREQLMIGIINVRNLLGWQQKPIEVWLGLPAIPNVGPGALIAAFKTRSYDDISALLASGYDPRERDAHGNTLLHLAAELDPSGATTIYKRETLRVCVQMQNSSGETPLLRAVKKRNSFFTRLLLYLAPDPNIADSNGVTPLFTALAAQDLELVRLLLKSSTIPISPQHQTADGAPALHFAVSLRFTGGVQALLDSGVDPNLRDSRGRTALMLCRASNGPDARAIERLLLAAGADLNARDNAGNTAGQSDSAAGA